MTKDGSIKRGMGKTFTVLVGTLIVLGLLAASGFYFMRYRESRKQANTLQSLNNQLTKQLDTYRADPNQAAQAESDKIITEVAKLYDLPKDEKPSVATVKDKTKLKDQPFFAKAENNDITLIYSKAKLAILYRPGTKQIINVSSVSIQDQSTGSPVTP